MQVRFITGTGKYSQHQKLPFTKIFGTVRQIKIRREMLIFLYALSFSTPETFQKQ